MMDWREYIISDEKIAMGKPVLKGTRIAVEFIVQRLASGWSEDQIIENYPRITKEHLQAVFSYVYDCMKDGLLFDMTIESV